LSGRIADTNVWIVASGDSSASHDCLENCFNWLLDFRESDDPLVIDLASLLSDPVPGNSVLSELRGNLKGGSFGRDLFDKVFMANYRLDPVDIEYDESGARLPDDIELPGFEPADRKWIALHMAHPDRPPIHNAYDGDWIKHEDDLQQVGIAVTQLCEAELRERVAAREGGRE
jgi:hypothetical protein